MEDPPAGSEPLRIDRLRDLVRDDRYAVDPLAVADAIIDHVAMHDIVDRWADQARASVPPVGEVSRSDDSASYR